VPSVDVTMLLLVLGSATALVLLAGGVWSWIAARGRPGEPAMSREERESWRMPALALLERPTWSFARRAAIVLLSGYLVLAIVLLVVKAVQLAMHR